MHLNYDYSFYTFKLRVSEMEYIIKQRLESNNNLIKENNFKRNFKLIDDHLNQLNLIDLFKDKEIKVCPHCNSTNFIKNGKFKSIQRYKCKNKNCSKTFSTKTNSPFSYSKKDITLWMKYLVLMNSGFSLRDCSSILSINLATSFYWRHKILVAAASNNNFKTLKNYVEVNKIMLNENFKGNRDAKYLSKEKIFVVCAIDNNNSILSKAIGRYSISLASISKNFYPNLDKSAFLSAFNDRCLIAFAKNHNSKLSKNEIENYTKNTVENFNAENPSSYYNRLPTVSKFTFNIYRWLIRFRGVATKYLENYLSWYILDYKFNFSLNCANQISLFKKLNCENILLKVKDFQNFKLLYQYNCIGNY